MPSATNKVDEPPDLMFHGDIQVEGEMPWSSNATLLVRLTLADNEMLAVYKPLRGERPLRDFPSGLYLREVAAYVLSGHLGWNLVPATIVRQNAPYGVGSLQRYVDADFRQHYFTLFEEDNTHTQLQQICAFDILINNADRKSGHCIIDRDKHIWGIDNGLAFHHEFKLRTVIWEFGDQPIPESILVDIDTLLKRGLPPELQLFLSAKERQAIINRAMLILDQQIFPSDPTGYRYPWPLI